jgi:hypothetical protein
MLRPIPTDGLHSRCKLVGMIYSVVPRELETKLFDQLAAHYAEDPGVTVIVDRRQSERRKREQRTAERQQREIRDRRRRRANGDFAPLHGDGS